MPKLVFRNPTLPGQTWEHEVQDGEDVGRLVESMRPWELDTSHSDSVDVTAAQVVEPLPQGEDVQLTEPAEPTPDPEPEPAAPAVKKPSTAPKPAEPDNTKEN